MILKILKKSFESYGIFELTRSVSMDSYPCVPHLIEYVISLRFQNSRKMLNAHKGGMGVREEEAGEEVSEACQALPLSTI
jgi:transcriptional regulator CtsR